MTQTGTRTVLVTGGGAGIGAETARQFRARGDRLVVIEASEANAAAIAAELPDAIVYTASASDPAQIDEVFTDLDGRGIGIDVLVNNVAHVNAGALTDITIDQIREDVEMTLLVAIAMTQRVLPGMIERGGGVILNVASINGLGSYGNEGYSVAKAGLINFTRTLAVEYGHKGIRANAVAPGTIMTGSWEPRLQIDPGLFDRAVSYYPVGRLGTAADVAAALVFLGSPEASFISGACLPVDGALTAGNYRLTRDLLVEEGLLAALAANGITLEQARAMPPEQVEALLAGEAGDAERAS